MLCHTIHLGNIHPSLYSIDFHNIIVQGKQINKSGTINVWQFDDIEKYILDSNKNMFTICNEYISILEELVADWLIHKQLSESKIRENG